jgi:hypothetical protein
MSPPDIYAVLTLEEEVIYDKETFLYAFSTVLILPSCREERDESDFHNKKKGANYTEK